MDLSLRRLLLGWLLTPLFLISCLGVGIAYLVYERPARHAYDQALADNALVLMHYLELRDGVLHLALPAEAERILRADPHDSVYFAVVDPEGRLIGGDAGLALPPRAAADGERTFYDGSYRGQRVRLAAFWHTTGDQRALVVVAETRNKLEALAGDFVLGALTPQLVVLGVLLAVVWFGVTRGLAPLAELGREIGARSPRDLRPVGAGEVVEELRPIVGELNALLARLDEAGAAQRRFIANAAHQLRTPLAGLQAQLELALADADPRERERRILACRDATQRTARLVQQLLALSASEPGARGPAEHARLDLAELVRTAMDPWLRDALARDIDLGFDLQPAAVTGDRVLLGELLANIVDNALRYGRPGGMVTVRCGRHAGAAYLEVEDDGPGIPAGERERVLERFYRRPGTPGPGSGLGLAIAREVAEQHGARLALEDGPGGTGLRVGVTFPS